MYEEPPLPITPTFSGREKKGEIMGFEGMLIIPVLISAMLSVGAVLLFMFVANANTYLAIGFGVFPFFATVGFIFIFFHKKPPGYCMDHIEWVLSRVPLIGRLINEAGVSFNSLPDEIYKGNQAQLMAIKLKGIS